MDLTEVENELSKALQSDLVVELLKEFKLLRKEFLKQDKIKIGIVSGRVCELVAAALYGFKYKIAIDLNRIEFDKFTNLLINLPKSTPEDELLTLNIPLVLKSVYSIRSKKKIAHIKKFDSNAFDAKYLHDACTWIFSQLIILFLNKDEEGSYDFIESITERIVPMLQEFDDGSIMVLEDNLSFKEELLLILYKISKRESNEKLKQIMKAGYDSKITTYLKHLNKGRLVHTNDKGSIITLLGIKYVETNLLQSTAQSLS